MNLQQVQLDGSLVAPSKIVCVGRNYVDHIRELGNEVPDQMVVFLKPNSAITQNLQSSHQEPLHYEAEICFSVKDQRIDAVGLGLDLTKRTLQSRLKASGLPWERAKAFDGSALFSPFVLIDDLPSSLCIELLINGERVQQGSIEQMIYRPEQILQECKTFLTLNDNDIIMTGTPKGVGAVKPGDLFHGKILQEGAVLTEASWVAS